MTLPISLPLLLPYYSPKIQFRCLWEQSIRPSGWVRSEHGCKLGLYCILEYFTSKSDFLTASEIHFGAIIYSYNMRAARKAGSARAFHGWIHHCHTSVHCSTEIV